MTLFLDLLLNVLNALQFSVFLWVVLSWFPVPRNHPILHFLESIVRPPLRLVRLLPHRLGMIDFSPLILLIALQMLSSFLLSFRISFLL